MASNEMTRYAFISHMEDYMKKLLNEPLKADVDDFLKSHNIDAPKALQILTKRADPDDENSAIIIKSTKIQDNGIDDDGKRKPDSFTVKYKIPRKDYTKKMRNLYINLFESNIIDGCPINEDGEGTAMCGGSMDGMGGATNSSSSGQYTVPLFGKPIKRKTMYITQEQADYLKKVLEEEAVMSTPIGNFGYEAPIGDGKRNKGNKFYDEANDHKNMMEKSWQGKVDEDIEIKKENKGKFNATKKRTGKTTEELTHSKNPLTRKRAIFAQNVKKWNKK